MGTESYAPPVDKLLTYGDGREIGENPKDWPQYLELGIGPEHISDLIRMATDEELRWAESDTLEVWAPIHAWRTLGALHAEEASEPLLSLLKEIDENDDDWVGEPPEGRYTRDRAKPEFWNRPWPWAGAGVALLLIIVVIVLATR